MNLLKNLKKNLVKNNIETIYIKRNFSNICSYLDVFCKEDDDKMINDINALYKIIFEDKKKPYSKDIEYFIDFLQKNNYSYVEHIKDKKILKIINKYGFQCLMLQKNAFFGISTYYSYIQLFKFIQEIISINKLKIRMNNEKISELEKKIADYQENIINHSELSDAFKYKY